MYFYNRQHDDMHICKHCQCTGVPILLCCHFDHLLFMLMFMFYTPLLCCVFQVMLVLMVFLLPLFCSKMSVCSLPETLPITSLVAYVHVSVWLLFLLLHLYIRRQHDVSRRYGYGMFYRRTVHLRRLTFYITSVGLSFFSHCL